MRVSLTTAGGFAAGIRMPAATLDSTTLDEAEVSELTELVNQATAENPSDLATRALPDAMSYKITIDSDESEPLTLRGSDGQMPPAFSQLLDFIRAHQ